MSYVLSSALENFIDTIRDEVDGERYAKRDDPSLRQSQIPVKAGRPKTEKKPDPAAVPTAKQVVEPLKIPGQNKSTIEKPILPPGGGSTTGLGLSSGSGSGLGNGSVFGSGTGALATDPGSVGAIAPASGTGSGTSTTGSGLGSETGSGVGSGIGSTGAGSGLGEESRRIAGSGLGYWDEKQSEVPSVNDVTERPQRRQTTTRPAVQTAKPSGTPAQKDESIPMGRLLVTFVLLLMSLVMLSLAGWGASAVFGMTSVDNGANEQTTKMMGMLMLGGGGLMGICMLAGAAYVLFLHGKTGSKSRRRR